MSKVFARLTGHKKLIKKLDKLQKKTRKRIEKKVLRAGAAVLKKAVKAAVPVDEGNLKKAIDYKLTGKGGAVIGANADYENGGDIPANYVHLVEYGYATADGGTVPGKHPIERGAKSAQDAAGAKMTEKTKEELNKLL